MYLQKTAFSVLAIFVLITSSLAQDHLQNIEITPHVGGQINGGLDIHTTLFRRIEVQNGLSYGITAGYLVGDHYGIEFQWNKMNAGTTAQPVTGAPSIKVFNLNQNQYMANFVVHLVDREHTVRPFAFFGLGASDLSPDRHGVNGTTRFAFSLGAGAKLKMTQHLGLRGQLKWSPTYITTTSTGGVWCDPFFGGCWVTGNSHYLHEFDGNVGIIFRF